MFLRCTSANRVDTEDKEDAEVDFNPRLCLIIISVRMAFCFTFFKRKALKMPS